MRPASAAAIACTTMEPSASSKAVIICWLSADQTMVSMVRGCRKIAWMSPEAVQMCNCLTWLCGNKMPNMASL